MEEKIIREQFLSQMGELKEEEKIIKELEKDAEMDKTITTGFLTIICC